jgi:serine/threonine-protein kinase HipA
VSSCLCCERAVAAGEQYHLRCLIRLFGSARIPAIPFGIAEIPAQLSKIGGRMSISGVQIKLSVRIDPDTWSLQATEVGGTLVLKPEPPQYPESPQNENVCMNLASELKMPVPPHGLFPMADGRLCYLVRRFDRLDDGTKLHKETLFQALNARHKYGGSLEAIGKALRRHVTNVGLDLLDFFERVILCFLIGNGDMHLKNWAFLMDDRKTVRLAPCYDLVSSKIYLPDEEDIALTMGGKRNRLRRGDFEALSSYLQINERAAQNSLRKLLDFEPTMLEMCAHSHLSSPWRNKLLAVMGDRYQRLKAG